MIEWAEKWGEVAGSKTYKSKTDTTNLKTSTRQIIESILYPNPTGIIELAIELNHLHNQAFKKNVS